MTTPTILYQAIKNNDLQGVLDALAAGVDPNRVEKHTAPVVYACCRQLPCDVAILEALLAAGADPNVCGGHNLQQSPLHRALGRCVLVREDAQNSGVELLLLPDRDLVHANRLLEAGAKVDATDSRGDTALFLARNEQSVRLLVGWGADLHARNAQGKTPLHCVMDPKAALALIEAGADVFAVDLEGNTPDKSTWPVLDSPDVAKIIRAAQHRLRLTGQAQEQRGRPMEVVTARRM